MLQVATPSADLTQLAVSVTKNTSAGLMIYRLVSKRSGAVYYMQSSLRVFFKNGKAESIGGTHRTLS